MTAAIYDPLDHDALLNELGQPVGTPVPGWTPRQAPPRESMEGRLCRVEPLDPARHAENLFAAYSADKEGRNWTYMGYGPFASPAALREWMEKSCLGADTLFHAVVDRRSRSEEHTSGLQSLMRNSYAVFCFKQKTQ